MELGPQNHHKDGLLGPNSIIVVYMDPLGQIQKGRCDYVLCLYACGGDGERYVYESQHGNPENPHPESCSHLLRLGVDSAAF